MTFIPRILANASNAPKQSHCQTGKSLAVYKKLQKCLYHIVYLNSIGSADSFISRVVSEFPVVIGPVVIIADRSAVQLMAEQLTD